MEIREIKYLIALDEYRNITKAAEKLFITQSSLSQFLSAYEKNLGVQIFVRTKKGIIPTRYGKEFIDELKKIDNQYKMAKKVLIDTKELKTGNVVLGISSFRARHMLPNILNAFTNLYKNINVEVKEADSYRLEKMLLDLEIDLAIIADPQFNQKIEYDFLMHEEIILVFNKNHRAQEFVQDGFVDIKDLSGLNFILGPKNTILRKKAQKLLEENKIEYSITNDNISAELALSMAQEGLGIGFSYRSLVEEKEYANYVSIGTKKEFIDIYLASQKTNVSPITKKILQETILNLYML